MLLLLWTTISNQPGSDTFLGKCGGLKRIQIGDFILPIGAIRGDGTSNDYLPAEVPAMPSFSLQKAICYCERFFNRLLDRNGLYNQP